MSTAPRLLSILLVLGAAGCTKTEGGGDGPDAAPALQFEPFVSTTWSLSAAAVRVQLSITDASGTSACDLSSDHANGLTGAGHQLITHVPITAADTCPVGMYPISMSGCPANLGTDGYVPESCAYYRRFDAQGNPLGIAVARNGEITITGSANSCTIRANIGFLGGSFSEDFTLTSATTGNPWCGE